MRKVPVAVCTALLVAGCGIVGEAKRDDTTVAYQMLRQDTITNADLWGPEPKMIAAGLGFTNIIGIPNLTKENVELSRNIIPCVKENKGIKKPLKAGLAVHIGAAKNTNQ